MSNPSFLPEFLRGHVSQGLLKPTMGLLQAVGFLVLSGTAVIAQTPTQPKPGNIVVPVQPLATPSICPAQLIGQINPIVNRFPSARWGILIQTQAPAVSRLSLYARNPEALLTPASNNKLFTTAAALQKLGAQYRIRTSVTANGPGPTLATLRITGRGDPSLKTAHMTVLAQRLSQRGIRQVALLIGDDTYFRGPAVNPNWDADDTLYGYGAPVNSLMLNQNGIGVTLFPQGFGQPLRVQWDDPTDAPDWRLNNTSVTASRSADEFVDVFRDRQAFIINVEGQLRVGAPSEPASASILNPGNYLIQ
jgi:D-alanyl-D-alanine carboxypeptidase/D-alanyl-D-alanine-endopeptidase (penicillin-binding protein 4)